MTGGADVSPTSACEAVGVTRQAEVPALKLAIRAALQAEIVNLVVQVVARGTSQTFLSVSFQAIIGTGSAGSVARLADEVRVAISGEARVARGLAC